MSDLSEARELFLSTHHCRRIGWMAPDGTFYSSYLAIHYDLAAAILVQEYGFTQVDDVNPQEVLLCMDFIRIDTERIGFDRSRSPQPTSAQVVSLYKLWQVQPADEPMKQTLSEFLNTCDHRALVELFKGNEPAPMSEADRKRLKKQHEIQAKFCMIEALPRRPGKARKVFAGCYIWKSPEGEIWNLNKNEELEGSDKWIAYSVNGLDYSDPRSTLKSLIASMEAA